MSTVQDIQRLAEELSNAVFECETELQPTFDEVEDGDDAYRLLEIFEGDHGEPICHIRFPIWKGG